MRSGTEAGRLTSHTLRGMCERFKRSYDVGMKGDEERVIQAFCAFLREQGWSTKREVGFIDVIAQKDGHRILAEAKGRTAAVGLDVDTMFGVKSPEVV